MKRIFALLMAAVMVVSMFALVGCGEEETLKLGLGSVISASGANATADAAGTDESDVTIAAVLVDKDGKIVKIALDCAQNKVKHTVTGTADKVPSFQTKYELGDNYNMVAYGGAVAEWYKQADAFEAACVGKDLAGVKALMGADYKAVADVQAAGCTIYVSDFVKAIEKAMNGAVASNATASDELKLGIVTSHAPTAATASANGTNEIVTTFVAAAVNSGKITACALDCAQVKITFDANGATTFDATKEILTKGELGDNYNMVAYGGAVAEWYKQAATFANACVGQNADGVKALMGADYKGNADVQAAGCTIDVSDFVAAATKVFN